MWKTHRRFYRPIVDAMHLTCSYPLVGRPLLPSRPPWQPPLSSQRRTHCRRFRLRCQRGISVIRRQICATGGSKILCVGGVVLGREWRRTLLVVCQKGVNMCVKTEHLYVYLNLTILQPLGCNLIFFGTPFLEKRNTHSLLIRLHTSGRRRATQLQLASAPLNQESRGWATIYQ